MLSDWVGKFIHQGYNLHHSLHLLGTFSRAGLNSCGDPKDPASFLFYCPGALLGVGIDISEQKRVQQVATSAMMGFPAGYSEYLVSKLFFNVIFLLASIRNGICWLLSFIGLAEFLEQEFTDPTDHSSAASSVTADMIRERLPVVTFGVLTDRLAEFDEVSCSVCLNEFDEYEEIRQLTNCCHIFHKNCLDKWLDHDQKTCPLCRTCLMPENIENDESEGSWAVERLMYLFGEDMVFQSQHTTQIR